MALTLAVVLILSGCTPAAKGPQKGGQITYGLTGDPVIFNPILSTDTPSDAIINLVYNGLVRTNEKLEMVPWLAEKWTVSTDGLTWTFTLRKNVKWHDGQPFTSADVKYTYEAIKDPDYVGIRATEFEPIDKIETPDANTVILKLKEPYAPLLSVLGIGIIPKHIFEKTTIANMKENPANMQPVGTGPYLYKEWVKGQHILLDANPNYWDKGPFIQKVIFRFYQDNQVMLAALEKGDIDYMGSIPFDEIDRIKKDYAAKYTFQDIPNNGYTYVGLKQTSPVFQDKAVRQALMYGANRQQIVTDVLKGRGQVPNANIMPESWAYAGDQLNQYKYDPEKAKQLLDQAGWKVGKDGIRVKDGKPLRFQLVTATGNKTLQAALNIIQQNWKAIGVDAKVEYFEWSVLLQQYLDIAKFESYALAWSLGVDPDFYLFFHSSSAVDESGQLMGFNDVEFKNPQLDKLLEQGRREMDPVKRKQIYVDAQKIVNEELPYVFLYQAKSTAAMNKKIQGVTWSTLGPLFDEQWFIDESVK